MDERRGDVRVEFAEKKFTQIFQQQRYNLKWWNLNQILNTNQLRQLKRVDRLQHMKEFNLSKI